MGVRTRVNVPIILRILEGASIPITWATVGHLFLESCERGSCGLAHSHMPRPPHNPHWDGDWYLHDPCTNLRKHPGWYAPDLIEMIRASSIRHEIGTHSFSHIDFSQETSNDELVRGELAECQAVMGKLGLKPKSLVYPRNRMGHQYLDIIADANITSVRHRDSTVRLTYPHRSESGVYKLYDSMNLRKGTGYDYPNKAKIFVGEAIQRNAAYHLWFHPSDETEVFENEFRSIIRHVETLRDQGKVWPVTMENLTAYCEARQKTKLTVERRTESIRVCLDSGYDVARYGVTDLTLRVPLPRLPTKCFIGIGSDRRLVQARPEVDRTGETPVYLFDIPATASELEIAY